MSTEGGAARSARRLAVARRLVALVVAALWLGASPALAQDAPAPAEDDAPAGQARALFFEGVSLLSEGRYEPARLVLERAFELEPRASTAFNLASALHGSGRTLAAQRMLERLGSGEFGELPAGFSDASRELRRQVRAALGRLVVTAVGPGVVAVTIDDEPEARLTVGEELAGYVAPGAHRLTARAPGHLSHESEISLAAGQTERVAIDLRVDPSTQRSSAEGRTDAAADEGLPGYGVGLIVGGAIAVVAGAVVLGVILGTASEGALRCDEALGCVDT